MTRKIAFFQEWSWFKFNNLGLALGTNLKFCTSVAKGLKLKVRKFWGPNPTFVEVTGEKLVGGGGGWNYWSSNFFSINFQEILKITKKFFLRSQLFYFALANIHLYSYDLFFKLVLLPTGDKNLSPGTTTLKSNKIPLDIFPFYNCDESTMSSKRDRGCNKEHNNCKTFKFFDNWN